MSALHAFFQPFCTHFLIAYIPDTIVSTGLAQRNCTNLKDMCIFLKMPSECPVIRLYQFTYIPWHMRLLSSSTSSPPLDINSLSHFCQPEEWIISYCCLITNTFEDLFSVGYLHFFSNLLVDTKPFFFFVQQNWIFSLLVYSALYFKTCIDLCNHNHCQD